MNYELTQKLMEAANKVEEIGSLYAEAKALSWLLQEQKKVVLASQMKISECKSAVERETNALCSEVYKNHLEGTKEAIADELRLKAQMSKWEYSFEGYRSLMSLEKMKVNVL